VPLLRQIQAEVPRARSRAAALARAAIRAGRLAIWVLALGALVLGADPRTPGAAERLTGPLAAEVISVIDGDTLEVRVRIWLGQDLNTRVRLAGIDAPELRGKCAREKDLARRARAYLMARLGSGATRVEGEAEAEAGAGAGAGMVRLRDIHYGKYAGRVLARVETLGGADLGQGLIDAGLARPYAGRARASWCESAGTASSG